MKNLLYAQKRIGCTFVLPKLWVILFAGFFQSCLLAQTQASDKKVALSDSLKSRSLDEVSIVALKISERNTSATPVQILSGKELEKLNSFSVADAIRYFSGVHLKDYGGIGGLKTINVRSLGSNHTAVFYDGVQVGNAQNGQVDLGKFSLDNIEEIALYNGQKSTIFQPAKGFASASSVYLKARQATFRQGKSNNFKISFKTGSFGLVNPSLLWQKKISEKISCSLNFEWIASNGKYKFRYKENGGYDTTAIRQNGDITAYRLEAGLNGKLRDSSAWNVRFYFYNSERGLPGAIVANKFNYSQRQWDKNFFIQSSYNKDFGKRYSFIINAKYANSVTRFLDPEIVTTIGFLDNNYHENEIYLSLANRIKITSFWDVGLSGDYQLNKLDANLFHFAYPTRHTFLNVISTDFHFKRLDLQGNLLSTYVEDKVKDFTASSKKTEYTPTLLLSFQPFNFPNLKLRGFYKSIFRMPTFNDLYYTLIGNIYLRPEYTKQYNAGFTYYRSFYNQAITYFSLQADAYYNQVTDKIIAVPSANLFRWTMVNLNKVEIKGVEINSQALWKINKINLTTGLSYTFQQALDITGNYNYKQQIPYVPLHSGSFLLSAEYQKFLFNYSFIYTGERYNLGANIPENYIQPWYTHDFSVGCNSYYHQYKLRACLEINNFLNQYYDVIVNFPMPGRSFRLTLNLTF